MSTSLNKSAQPTIESINKLLEDIKGLDDFECAIQRLNPTEIKAPPHSPSGKNHSTINLPQLPLPTYNGDPKLWKEFWNKAMERILRQLEAIGENLEHSCLKIIIESGLPSWVLDK
ncbi:unnamed protein product, partial [Acanthocheilonema viteae]